MKALLSFDQAPPIDVPLRFLLSAIPFGAAAGLLLMFSGDALASRWNAASLGLTHVFTVGLMLQAMTGAMLQLTPVAIGANIGRPRLIAGMVHPAMILGAAALVAAFLTQAAWLFLFAGAALGSAIGIFAIATLIALSRAQAASGSAKAMRIALACLIATAIWGVALAAARAGMPSPDALLDTTTHLRLGWLGWGLCLLCGASFMVVPMFQLTPQYPAAFQRLYAPGLALALLLGFAPIPTSWTTTLLALCAAGYAATTLWLQHQRRRPRIDTSFRFWRVALTSTLAAAVLAILSPWIPDPARIEVLLGILVLLGGFGSVICAMTYKIVPFLVWLHLNNAGADALLMHQVIEEKRIAAHLKLHVPALVTALGVPWLPPLSLLAGALLASAYTLQGVNMYVACRRYRERMKPPQPHAAG